MQRVILLLLAFFCLLTVNSQNKEIIFSEIYYDSGFSELTTVTKHHQGEYIELYNTTNEDVDLGGWYIKENVGNKNKYSFPSGTMIKAKGFLVLTYGSSSYTAINYFPNVSENTDNLLFQTTIMLFNEGEKTALYDDSGNIIDVFAYGGESFQGSTWNFNTSNTSLLAEDPDKYMYLQKSIQRVNIGDKDEIATSDEYVIAVVDPFNINIDASSITDETDETALNYTETKIFDEYENVVGWSKSYFDGMGRALQSQTYDFENENAIVSQTLYDKLGRGVVESMAVPVEQNTISYIEDFFQDEEGDIYSYENFDDDKLDDPDPVSTSSNTVGWYYSSNNSDEPYVDQTNYPYARVEYSSTLGGAERRRSMPGDAYKMGSGHEVQSYTMPASDDELEDYLDLDEDIEYKNLTKTVSIDADGKRSVSYVNEDGQLIASALLSDVYSGSNIYTTEVGYIDICTERNGPHFIGLKSGTITQIIDLTDDQEVSCSLPKSATSTLTLGTTAGGYYRIIGSDSFTIMVFANKLSNVSINVYDDAGRLKKAYQPLAITNSDPSYCTSYYYNSLGWLIKTESKDQGISNFVYRKDGQILFSQNAQQKNDGKFSYSIYDDYNRVIESGEYDEDAGDLSFWNSDETSIALTQSDLLSADLRNEESVDYLTQRHRVWYGQDGNEESQSFVNGAMSKTEYDGNSTYYSYTYDGKLDWVIRDHAYLGAKKIEYTYDFFGNVTQVTYQDGESDQFTHYYTYNNNQQLVKVYTKLGSNDKELQAEYEYYPHGALKRIEIAEDQQGIDYVYNVNGLLKSINHPGLTSSLDPGGDGGTSSSFREDLFGLALDYYSGDYAGSSDIKTCDDITSYYSGQIAMARWKQFQVDDDYPSTPVAYKYSYNDQNYLEKAIWGQYYHSSNTFDSWEEYSVRNITYDDNGNIQTLDRYGYDESFELDNLTYQYDSDNANRLSYLTDGWGTNIGSSYNYYDIGESSSSNLNTYNAIGQMTYYGEGYRTFTYDATGKVSHITLGDGEDDVYFYYDDTGFRSTKYNGQSQTKNHYIRDISGNIMAVYDTDGNMIEAPIYGSGRIGITYINDDVTASVYELSDHLGNVRATFSKDDETGALAYADYYPFGMKMPGCNYESSNDYRFGYQGQYSEEDEETGYNQFEARLYDARIGRWLTTDPASQFYSPYLAMGNDPVYYVDENGEFIQLITAGIGAVINTGVTIYSMSKEAGGFKNIDWNGQAWSRVGTSFATGALAGSGLGGLAGGVAASLLGNGADQVIRNDFSFKNFDLVEFGASGFGAWAGGKIGTAVVGNKWVSSIINANLAPGLANQILKEGMSGTIGSFAGWQTGVWSTEAIHGLIDAVKNTTLLPGVVQNNSGGVYIEDANKIINKKNPSNYVTFPITPIVVTPN